MRTIVISIAVGVLAAKAAVAGDCRSVPACCDEIQACGTPDQCGHCGTKSCCRKVCRTVCEMKKVKKTVWAVECEEFCAPLPNCGHGCKSSCGSCGDGCGAKCGRGGASCGGCGNDPCKSLHNRSFIPPKCGKVRCRKKLVKKEVTCEVPVYKCVVVYCCPGCAESPNGGEESAPEAAPAPTRATTHAAPPLPPALGWALRTGGL